VSDVPDVDPFDLLAAELRADGADARRAVDVLAVKLADALPHATEVRRARKLFSRSGPVESVVVTLGDARYSLHATGAAPQANRETVVRGVTIKRDELGLEQWVREITDELQRAAAESAEARGALERLLGQ
jgi:hypothetical protein